MNWIGEPEILSSISYWCLESDSLRCVCILNSIIKPHLKCHACLIEHRHNWIMCCQLVRTYCFICQKSTTKYGNKNGLTELQSVNSFRCSNVVKIGIYLHKSLCRNRFYYYIFFKIKCYTHDQSTNKDSF